MRFTSLPKTLLTVHHHLTYYPTPPNISYAWSFGGLALVVMVVQIATGVFLTMHYNPDTFYAFWSVEQHIMRDVNYGWIARYLHANGASFIFLLMYWHMGRSMYFKTYNPPRQILWISGVIIFLLLMATGFLGYVLPWGQMSFWGATVITNLFSAIPVVGPYIAVWLWGGFSVGKATLVKFFTLHYMLPFVVLGILTVHISLLHELGSTESVQEEAPDTWEFGVYFAIKDTLVFLVYLLIASYFIYYAPNLLGHSDNAIQANNLVTPLHIVPEWYFLPFYAILKCVPNKRLGVLMMVWSIIYFLFYGDSDPRWNMLLTKYTPSYYWYRSIFWLFVANFLILGSIGALPAQAPYTEVGRVATWLYFVLLVLYAQPTPGRYIYAWAKYIDEIHKELHPDPSLPTVISEEDVLIIAKFRATPLLTDLLPEAGQECEPHEETTEASGNSINQEKFDDDANNFFERISKSSNSYLHSMFLSEGLEGGRKKPLFSVDGFFFAEDGDGYFLPEFKIKEDYSFSEIANTTIFESAVTITETGFAVFDLEEVVSLFNLHPDSIHVLERCIEAPWHLPHICFEYGRNTLITDIDGLMDTNQDLVAFEHDQSYGDEDAHSLASQKNFQYFEIDEFGEFTDAVDLSRLKEEHQISDDIIINMPLTSPPFKPLLLPPMPFPSIPFIFDSVR